VLALPEDAILERNPDVVFVLQQNLE
jgi:hypothetical protein